jgi:hypothetical protein
LAQKFKVQQEEVIRELKTGDKIEKAVESVYRARDEMVDCLLQSAKQIQESQASQEDGESKQQYDPIDLLEREGRQSSLQTMKIIRQMDEAVEWMNNMREHGVEFV